METNIMIIRIHDRKEKFIIISYYSEILLKLINNKVFLKPLSVHGDTI